MTLQKVGSIPPPISGFHPSIEGVLPCSTLCDLATYEAREASRIGTTMKRVRFYAGCSGPVATRCGLCRTLWLHETGSHELRVEVWASLAEHLLSSKSATLSRGVGNQAPRESCVEW